MKKGEHNNFIKESGFSRKYLSLNWHQTFFSGSVKTQGSVPRGVLRLSFVWLALDRQERHGRFCGTDKLEEVGDWLKIGIWYCQCVYLISTFSCPLYSHSAFPSPRLTYMIPWWLFQLQPYISREAWAAQLPASSDPLNPEGPNWSKFSRTADLNCKFGFCYQQTLIIARLRNFCTLTLILVPCAPSTYTIPSDSKKHPEFLEKRF